MIQANNISLSFGEQDVFDNVSFSVQDYQRIGLVGRNGSGKSTLLRVIAGMQQLDSGVVSTVNNRTIAYMPQEVILQSTKSVFEETFSTFEKIYTLQQKVKELEPNVETDPHALEEYTHVQEELAQLQPALAKAETEQVLQGLGFSKEQMEKSVSDLSVGWKMRVVLAKLLLQKADFYLFDEPTNHLDIVAKDWFITFLKKAPFGFMLVSHERHFLDQLCTEILELERGKATFYMGNYSDFEKQKARDRAQLEAAYTQQQKEIKQKKATINRFRASATKAKMAQSMMRQLENVKLIELPPSARNVSFSFPSVQRAGREVLEVKNLAHAFGEKQIFKDVSFSVERGERVAVIAPNGVGKTTLFNLIVGKLPKQTGSVELGYNVDPAIFAQDQSKALDLNKTIFENLSENCAGKGEGIIRSFLGAFLFSNDDVHKKVKVLSGGEKNRVGMAQVLMQDANLLLLDEPTNHLDMISREILLKALQSYEGTMLFVSHDHDFVNKLATRVLELTPEGIHSYPGNYEEYLYQKEHRQESPIRERTVEKKGDNKQSHEQRKQLKKLENKINKLEKKIQKIEHSFADIAWGTPEFDAAQEKLDKLKRELKTVMSEWATLSS